MARLVDACNPTRRFLKTAVGPYIDRASLASGYRGPMSLISFHRFLITTAIFFCGGYSIWEFVRFSRSGTPGEAAQGALFALLALLLIVYFNRMAAILGYRKEE